MEWHVREGFPEVPGSLTEESEWEVLHCGALHLDEDISMKEARGFLWGLRYRAKNLQHHGHRMLFLVDNFGLAFAINRGRSPHYHFLQVCRQVAAMRIATDILPCVRWVCSEQNPMDKPSRVYMDPQRFELSRQRFLQRKAQSAWRAQGGRYEAPWSASFPGAHHAGSQERRGGSLLQQSKWL